MDKKEEVLEGFAEVFNKRAWLNKVKMEKALAGYAASEVHCIEFIGKHNDPNVTKMAESLYMTRGAISKLTKKMLEKNYIESYQKADNKKEIYYKLTAKGKRVFELHEQLHKEFEERDQIVFEPIKEEQYNAFLEFLERYNQHLDQEIKKQNLTIK
ncbi:MarR family winged helix-turn-helix transcriptional regulator [Enterococcus avium]|uniref:MarR family winged helix-turn-helix transcriptional regulator n=1 Tax=Enterococcus avium TaxID=33945 RepID=UPI00288EE520|nr:MarR family transcriptional regulator [Enterococcus avium]MDT2565432.1 MarR family transcriptional regulator [Enterococcus avium]